ncbi:MAG: LLM class flavin-dependent oxidoreductase [Deltaproteobacteria bacterium]|nr:MAG: LLM class flavin-dependent oxidoreductase [Deltaproteobacteria bacterium]
MVPGLDRERILGWARRIDAGPFSSLCAGERIAFPNPEVMVTLAAAAAVTERVRLAFSVLVLPMHSAVLIAKQVATLDVVSAGRVVLGVGVGAREEDYRAVGAAFDSRRFARLEHQVALMRRAWAGESVVEGALRPVEPLPVQPGGPEILAGSLFPRSIRRAARWADGINGFSFGPSPEEVERSFELAREAWKAAGRETPPRLTTSFWFALGPGAREQLDRYLGRYLNFMGPGVAEKLAPTVTVTSAQALKNAVKQIAELGTDELWLVPTTSDPEEVDRVADLLG